jgi:hypothetical protein
MPSFQDTIPYSLFMLSKIGVGWKRTKDLARELLLPPVKAERENTGFEVHWFLSILSNRLFRPLQDFGLWERQDLPDQQKRPGVDLVRKTTLFDSFVSFHLE